MSLCNTVSLQHHLCFLNFHRINWLLHCPSFLWYKNLNHGSNSSQAPLNCKTIFCQRKSKRREINKKSQHSLSWPSDTITHETCCCSIPPSCCVHSKTSTALSNILKDAEVWTQMSAERKMLTWLSRYSLLAAGESKNKWVNSADELKVFIKNFEKLFWKIRPPDKKKQHIASHLEHMGQSDALPEPGLMWFNVCKTRYLTVTW